MMNSVSVFLLARLGIGLLLGIYLLRFLNPMLRATVMWMTPMHRRLAPDAFNRQRRIITFVSILLTLVIAFFFNEGVTLVVKKIESPAATKSSLPLSLPEVITTPDAPEPLPIDPPPKETVFSFEPSISPVETKPETPPPPPVERLPQKAIFYFQVEAFDDFARAQKALPECIKETGYECRIVLTDERDSAYKIILDGSFYSRKEATTFARKHKIYGFPRPAAGLFSAQPRFVKSNIVGWFLSVGWLGSRLGAEFFLLPWLP